MAAALLISTALAAASAMDDAPAAQFDCATGCDRLIERISDAPGSDVRDGGEWLVVDQPERRIIYFITRDGGNAHPAIFQRAVVDIDGAATVRTVACAFGDEAAARDLLQQFARQDQLLTQRMQR